MIEQLAQSSGTILGFKVSGRLHDEDFQTTYLPLIAAAAVHGQIGILVEFADDFSGWDAHALWDEVTYHTKYVRNIKRMALVGDAKWLEWMSKLSKGLPVIDVRHFPASEIRAAWDWLGNFGQRNEEPLSEGDQLSS